MQIYYNLQVIMAVIQWDIWACFAINKKMLRPVKIIVVKSTRSVLLMSVVLVVFGSIALGSTWPGNNFFMNLYCTRLQPGVCQSLP